MEPIELNIDGECYIAMPQWNGSFDILRSGSLLGNIFADNGINTELIWSTSDLIDLDLVQKIGESIQRAEL
jgi:hypothetical protein